MDLMRSWLGSMACDGCGVRRDAVCAGLSGEAFADFRRMGRRRTVSRGQVLIWEGEESLVVGTLVSGALKISAATSDGREQIVGLAWPSDFVGSPIADRSGFRVTALSDSQLCVFDRADFQAFAEQAPGLERDLLRRTLDDLGRARAFMLLLGRMSAGERLAALLLDMAARLAGPASPSGAVVALSLRRQEIADVLGLTIETVSRQFRSLNDAGIIAMPDPRTIVIADPERLEAIAAA